MAEIVNLKRARKAKTRGELEKAAAANRARFGTPKALRDAEESKREQSARKIDAHKLDGEG